MVRIGHPAPDFTATTTEGKPLQLSSRRGAKSKDEEDRTTKSSGGSLWVELKIRGLFTPITEAARSILRANAETVRARG